MQKKFQFTLLFLVTFGLLNCNLVYSKTNNINNPPKLELASLFKDHMILQRDMIIPVWGSGEIGTTVTVKFANSKRKTIVGADGKWRVDLKPLKASFISRSMEVSSSRNKKSIVLQDILVGEVWICSGQSNMEYPVRGAPKVKKLIPSSKNIRSFTVENTVAFETQKRCEGKWINEHPNSAVAFSFAYFLEKYADIPVGIILTSWGSSSLEAWMPREMTNTVPYFKKIMDDFDADNQTIKKIQSILDGPRPFLKSDNVFIRRQSNILYNAMMHPLIPYACRGLVWYQGERNTQSMYGMVTKPWFSRNSGMLKYGETLKKWVNTYRQLWNNDKMHFSVVMLPGYGKVIATDKNIDKDNPAAHSWAWMRESQLKVLELSNTSVINTIDLGDIKNIHPKDKLPIGKRLALVTMKDVLNNKVESYGPIFKKVTKKGKNLIVHYKYAKGLKTKDGKTPNCFWLSDDSNKWVPATAKIKGETIVLSTLEIDKPLYVRYAFTAKPNVNLINRANLPAQPFRTDVFMP